MISAVAGGFDALIFLRFCKMFPSEHFFTHVNVISLEYVDVSLLALLLVEYGTFSSSRSIISTSRTKLLFVLSRKHLF